MMQTGSRSPAPQAERPDPPARPAPEDLGGRLVRVTASPGRLRIAPIVPWALPMLQGVTTAAWVALYLSGLGATGSSLIVCLPWTALGWKRAWRRAERGVIDRIGRALVIEQQAPMGNYRDLVAPPQLTIDGRAIAPSQVGGLSTVPSTTVRCEADGRVTEVPGPTSLYLHVAERSVFLLSATPDRAARVASLLCERLRIDAPRTPPPWVTTRAAFNPRSEAGRRAFAEVARSASWNQPRSPMPSEFYGGWRVLSALLALYVVSAMPVMMTFLFLDGCGSPPRLTNALTAAAGFLVADQLGVTVWGWIFRAPVQEYTRALFGAPWSVRYVP